MPAPEDPEKYRLWKEKLSKSLKDRFTGSKSPHWKEKIKKTCLICNVSFDVIPSLERRKCCSRECMREMCSGKNNPMFGRKRSDLAKWNRQHSGGKHIFFGQKRPGVAEQMMGEKNLNYGRHPSQETRDKMSEAKRGEKSSNYLDGRSYEPYTSDFNKQLKTTIRYRDGYKCQICGISEAECLRKLDVHHIDYNKKNIRPCNLISLCIQCHRKMNKNKKHWKRKLKCLN